MSERKVAGARVDEPQQRAPWYRAAGARLVDGVPVMLLGFERRTYAVALSLSGFAPNPVGRDYWNAWQFARR